MKIDEKKFYNTLMNSLLCTTFFCGAMCIDVVIERQDWLGIAVSIAAMVGPLIAWWLKRRLNRNASRSVF